jgi:N-acetyl-anhydromuramyl-L-alanine amidase AmpD
MQQNTGGRMARVKRPTWTDLPARYLNKGRNGILGIVLHDTAGSGTHDDTLYLQNPTDGRQVSVDFTVERDGAIWKLNPDLPTFFCNHAGRATAWRNYQNREVNRVTIGIEIVQHSELILKPVYPLVQVQAVAQLCAWITSTFRIEASDITTHRQIITDGSRSDPRQFPFDGEQGFWRYYWAALGMEENFLASL